MKMLITLSDADFGFDTPQPTEWKERSASRAIIFDADKKVALLHVTKKQYHKLPGGGVEEGESLEEALRRESLEEIGCHITNIRELGMSEEHRTRFGVHQICYCYIADVEGEKGAPNFTQEEIAGGFEIVWLPFDDALKLVESETFTEGYQRRFIHARELAFLKEAKKKLESV